MKPTDSIVVRAPLRVSFGGGGTDLEAYYANHDGFVVSAAIDRYCYVIARPPAGRGIQITSADYGIQCSFPALPSVEEPLSLPRAALDLFADRGLRERGINLFLAAEVPSGTGLGSSSAMAVALVQAISAYLDIPLATTDVAEGASRVEIDTLDMPIGRQDQYASAFGGLNAITFTADGVAVQPIMVPAETVDALFSRLLLFSTGKSRDSASILRQQRSDTESSLEVTKHLHRIKALAHQMHDALLAHDLDGFGGLLHEAWETKRRLSGKISSPEIDAWYGAARSAGALGGKITGAGGGGFLLLYCPPEKQARLRHTLTNMGLEEMPFALDHQGARVLTSEAASIPTSTIISARELARERWQRHATRTPREHPVKEDIHHA